METDVIYDRYGSPILRILNDDLLVDFFGNNIGFKNNSDIYNYNGFHVGWYFGGILRDHFGNVVGFGENPTDYPFPILPIKQLKPTPYIPQIPPLKPIPNIPPFEPFKTFSWSIYDPLSLFSNIYG